MKTKLIIIAAGIGLLIVSCAKEGMPPGGPEDKTPPVILNTFPENEAVRVDPNTEVLIQFSEIVKIAQPEDAIFISPFPGENVKYGWKGKALSIKFPEPLRENRTYVVTVGTKIKDLRNNPLAETFALAFSTGDSLDRCTLSGIVESPKSPQGIDVWAYQIEEDAEPDPANRPPDYRVQCDQSGRFAFSNLAEGTYRLFAVRDQMADNFYQRGEDEIGVPCFDVRAVPAAGSPAIPDIYFKTCFEDTTAPSLVRARANDSNSCTVQFDEEVLPDDGDWLACFEIHDTQDSLNLLAIHEIIPTPLKSDVITLLTDTMTGGCPYQLKVSGFSDLSGNAIDTNYCTADFTGESRPDTMCPSITIMEPNPGTRDVLVEEAVHLIFSEPMDTTGKGIHLAIDDSTQMFIAGTMDWWGSMELYYYPNILLDGKTAYRVFIDSLSLSDLAGNFLPDTTWKFTTINPDTLSEISGIITDPEATASGSIVVQARTVGKTSRIQETYLFESGLYSIKNLLPGLYVLSAYRDSNEDGFYSYGMAYPYLPSERYMLYSDTVKIRSRWPNEGNDFSLPPESFYP